jgi:hypothetical protein
MQLEMGMSTKRYLPPNGTAGFERCQVRGKSRVPAPPPKISAKTLCLRAILLSRRL